jgi:hypothetical protein
MTNDQIIEVLNKLIVKANERLELCDGADRDLPFLEGYIAGLERSKKAIAGEETE